ncbi:MAG: GTP 3',8-cyclase MoaA [Flavobacteriales bacterium]|nr:GTP 3',8-cyclase MoaA [Flavobacteriales bacterium]
MLTDNHHRPINYLRLAVTDRCNLRCLYCMPKQGLDWVPRKQLLSFEEILRLLKVFSDLGITKLRFTGGEPFLRKDFMKLVEQTFSNNWFEKIAITTNGTLTAPYIKRLKELGIHSINLSLDTFNRERFELMSRRDDFSAVMNSFELLLQHEIPTRINAVIMEGKNEEDIFELAELTKDFPVDVRFIEEMPFNGVGQKGRIKWNQIALMEKLRSHYPAMIKVQDEPHSTSYNYHVPGHLGNIGIIAAYTRSFCGTCNRIRLTPQGMMKTCLYDEGKIQLRDLLRSGAGDESMAKEIIDAIHHRAKNGFEAEQKRGTLKVSESMATIGG